MRIPIKVLIVLTGVISTTVSMMAGLLLYFEGLRLLERTVEEVSRSDRQAVASMMQGTFHETIRATEFYRDMLQTWEWVDREMFSTWVRKSMVYYTYRSSVLYGVGMSISPLVNITYNKTSWYDVAWFDMQEDGSRLYVHGHYDESHWNHSSCRGGRRCAATYSMDLETGKRVKNVYNFTEGVTDAVMTTFLPKMTGWEQGGVEWWRAPAVWYGPDGTPSMYLTYYNVLPAMEHHRLFRDTKVTVRAFLLLSEWQRVLDMQPTESKMVVMAYGENNYVMATNIGLSLAKKGCSNDNALQQWGMLHPCITRVDDLPEDVRKGAMVLNGTEEGRFVRHEGLWVVRTVVQSPRQEWDDFDTIQLLWMRSVSSVEDELTRALVLFVVFMVVILVFDVVIAVTEVVLLARPLKTLAAAMPLLEMLDLAAVDSLLRSATTTVSEIGKVFEGMHFVVAALREYKSFIPEVHKAPPTDQEDLLEVTSMNSLGSGQNSGGTSGEHMGKLAVQIQETVATVATLEMPGGWSGGTQLMSTHTEWLSEIQQLLGASRGTLHRVQGTRVVVAWNLGVRTVGHITKAVGFAAALKSRDEGRTHVGIASGSTLAGNMGTATSRHFNLVGCVEERAGVLCTLNSTFKTSAVGDGTVFRGMDSDPRFLVRQIDKVVWPQSLGDKEEAVCEVVGTYHVPTEEWMYQVESVHKATATHHNLWATLSSNKCNYAMALATIRELAAGDQAMDALHNRVQQFAANCIGHYHNVITPLLLAPRTCP
eukprot:Sspe_Gene.77362::Locus_48333_Transcript_3_3_Confidence_0.500_Length_2464::g.77362::m.77362